MRIFNLTKKTGNLTSNDFFGVDNGSTVNKIDYNALAKAIIEQYTGSSLAGSAQSVKAALDSLNSKMGGMQFVNVTVSATASKTLNFSGQSRGVIISSAAGVNSKTFAIYNAATNGTTTVSEVHNSGTSVQYDASDNTIQITNNSAASIYIVVAVFNGSMPTIS